MQTVSEYLPFLLHIIHQLEEIAARGFMNEFVAEPQRGTVSSLHFLLDPSSHRGSLRRSQLEKARHLLHSFAQATCCPGLWGWDRKRRPSLDVQKS